MSSISKIELLTTWKQTQPSQTIIQEKGSAYSNLREISIQWKQA